MNAIFEAEEVGRLLEAFGEEVGVVAVGVFGRYRWLQFHRGNLLLLDAFLSLSLQPILDRHHLRLYHQIHIIPRTLLPYFMQFHYQLLTPRPSLHDHTPLIKINPIMPMPTASTTHRYRPINRIVEVLYTDKLGLHLAWQLVIGIRLLIL